MDADSVCMIIDNIRACSESAYERVTDALRAAGKLPGQPGDRVNADEVTARAVGEVIENMIQGRARLDHGLRDKPGDLTAELFATMLGHIDWRDVGEHYHTTTRERYAYANGYDPYP